MKRRLLLCLAMGLLAAPVMAQPLDSASITGGGSDCSVSIRCLTIPLPTQTISTAVAITGTFSATLQFEGSADGGVTWFSVLAIKMSDGSSATSTTATGLWSIANGGLTHVRVRCSAYTSGTANVTAVRGYATAKWLTPFLAAVYADTFCLDRTNQDTCLVRDAANTLAQRNGTNAQAFNLYNTFTDATHYEDLRIFWSTNVANIVTDFANASARALVIGTLGANSLQLKTNNLVRWLVDSSGNLVANSDNSVDFGASGANRARNAYIGTSVVTPVFRSAQTTAPTCTSNCGTSPAVVGGDSGGIVTMGATGSPASGWVLTFNGTWAAAPSCTVQMAKAGMVVGKMPLTVVTSTTTVTVVTNGTAPANSDQYAYHCIGVQ